MKDINFSESYDYESPHSFEIKKDMGGKMVKYSGLREISQGGPIVGYVSINDQLIKSFEFGGPAVSRNSFLYLPVYLHFSFKLGKVDMNTLRVERIGEEKDLIYLKRIDDDRIYYHENLKLDCLKFYSI